MDIKPNMHQYDSYRNHVKSRLVNEVVELQHRVSQLQQSSSRNRDVIISVYQKMIDQKQHFMRDWKMADRAAR
ncbi:hypothetical protein [Alkalimarinus sediminis]|uniref:Uncharacterized protein n=1 Tax=Alkalimarinus sediminis TaxID=1632866 RepID=A0A9E8KNZ4_9ALTE|nr:hypothetical protein [Alkalimarinus sediminis]UZW74888.1 hypothetical protein NNL22_17990 [Alkalimarinus sediminis]